MSSAASIRSAINTQLSAVTELSGGVYIGRTGTFTGFPCARFYLDAIQEEKENADTGNNYRVYVYRIDIIMTANIPNVTKQASEEEFEDAIDAVMDRLNNNWTLGGTVESSSIEPSQVRYEEISQGGAVYLPLTLYAKTLIPIS